jgi:hypothetical protein
MNITIRKRYRHNPSPTEMLWDAITRYPSGIVETLNCAPFDTADRTMEYVRRMQEVGMLPAEINVTVEEN